jgi:hypothetical protein
VSCRGEEYKSGPPKDWDVDLEIRDSNLSLAALSISENASSIPQSTGFCSAFCDEFDEYKS